MKTKKILSKIKGIFFKDKKSLEAAKAEEMLKLYVKYLPELKRIQREAEEQEFNGASPGQVMGQMYDFFEDHGETTRNGIIEWDNGSLTVNSFGSVVKSKDDRMVATPVSVLVELETVPTPFTCEALDEKIATLKDKTALLNQRFAKDQIKGLCKRLENRKKYKENQEFFNRFPNTTDDKIDNLLKKYKLEFNTSDLFIPTFPKEAIDIMKEYTKVTKKVSGETPVFYVIAEEKDFKKKREKLDPILLVQSPFGFYWQILGAWDKEMLLLTEL